MNEAQRRILDVLEWNNTIITYADPSRKVLDIEYYSYALDWNNPNGSAKRLTPTTPRSFEIIMDSDSDFVATHMSGGAQINLATTYGGGQQKVQNNPALLLQITDKSSAKTYFNVPTLMPFVCGFNGFPFIFTSPRLIKPRSTMKFDFTTADDAGSCIFYGVYLAMHGAKIYYA